MNRSLVRLTTSFLILISALAEPVWACSVCYGAAEASVIDGMNMSIVFMLVLTYVIVGGFLVFFLYLRKREQLFTSAPDPSAHHESAAGSAVNK